MKKKISMLLIYLFVITISCSTYAASAKDWNMAFVNHSYLNLRTKPSTKSSIKLVIDGYSKIAELPYNSKWSKVYLFQDGKSYTGYAYRSYLKRNPKPYVGYVKSKTLKIRKTHSASGKTLVTLKKNQPVYFTGKRWGYWAQVSFGNGKLGWVNEVYTKTYPDFTMKFQYYVNHSYLNLRESYGTDSPIIMRLSRNDKIKVLEKIGSWWFVNASHEGCIYGGWVYSPYLAKL